MVYENNSNHLLIKIILHTYLEENSNSSLSKTKQNDTPCLIRIEINTTNI